MKIIGHTAHGYLAELSPQEIAAITGDPKTGTHSSQGRWSGQYSPTHEIGAEFNVNDTWKHLQHLLQNEEARKRIAESLRAAATLIEHTPSPITPPQPTPTDAAPVS